jgi:hypothetical protein
MATSRPNIAATLTRGNVAAPASAPRVVRLAPDGVCAVRPTNGRRIRCVAGVAWVTQEGVAEDIVLAAGEIYAPRRSGKIIVQALSARGATVTM